MLEILIRTDEPLFCVEVPRVTLGHNDFVTTLQNTTMHRILISPADYSISSDKYGKSFNLLSNINSDSLSIDAYVSTLGSSLSTETVTVHEFGRNSKLRYYADAFRLAIEELRAGNVDVYQHLNLSYGWFNPVLLAGLQGETPVVIGPCQAGHAVLAEEFNMVLGDAVGANPDRALTDPLYRLFEATRGVAIDPVRMALFKRTLQSADKVVVVHEEAKELYENFVDESKLEVIPLGVNPSEFEYTERSDSSSIVGIGRLKRRKGFDILLDGMAQICTERPDVHLDIFGKGPLKSELRQQASDLGITENVTFHGHVDQSVLKEYLADARMFVHPSRSESFSLVRLEAMASGCPVVVSDIDGAREMVRDGKDGFVVPREDPDTLAERMLDVLSDVKMTKDMGHSARERVERKYDWSTIGDQYVDVYQSLL